MTLDSFRRRPCRPSLTTPLHTWVHYISLFMNQQFFRPRMTIWSIFWLNSGFGTFCSFGDNNLGHCKKNLSVFFDWNLVNLRVCQDYFEKVHEDHTPKFMGQCVGIWKPNIARSVVYFTCIAPHTLTHSFWSIVLSNFFKLVLAYS